jgi:pyruvate kinase
VDSTDELIRLMDERLEAEGIARQGDVVVIVAGIPLSARGRANFLKIHIVGTSE